MVELLKCMAIQGLEELGDKAYSIKENIELRVRAPPITKIIKKGHRYGPHQVCEPLNLWCDLLSKTTIFHGHKNEDNKFRFKIEHELPPLELIANRDLVTDKEYEKSNGTEFIIIWGNDLKLCPRKNERDYEKNEDYQNIAGHTKFCIRSDKYKNIRNLLLKDNCKIYDILEAGGFKCDDVKVPERIPSHDGWLEYAVGKNNAMEQDYAEARGLLREYATIVSKINRPLVLKKGQHYGRELGKPHSHAMWMDIEPTDLETLGEEKNYFIEVPVLMGGEASWIRQENASYKGYFVLR